MSRPTVAVIVLYYNRPRMLTECLASVREARPDQVVLVDDGSELAPPPGSLHELPDPAAIIAPSISPAERLKTPRLGRLINHALDMVRCDVVAYLCDDDLVAPGWYAALRSWATAYPKQHVARGDWWAFDDGADPYADPRRPVPLDWRGMTTGNFAHRIACYRDEGLSWDETRVAVHDDTFVWRVNALHPIGIEVADLHVTAGYRREHAYNMLQYTRGDAAYTASARAVITGGPLEGVRT